MIIQGRSSKIQKRTKGRPNEQVRSESRSSSLCAKGINQINLSGDNDKKRTESDDESAQDRYDPMRTVVGAPAVQEAVEGSNGAELFHHDEALFGLRDGVFLA